MAMTSVSVVTAVFVLNLHHRGSDRRPVPRVLRRFLAVQSQPPAAAAAGGFTLRHAHSPPRRRHDVSLHDNDWTLTMTVETLATELSHELHSVTVRTSHLHNTALHLSRVSKR